MASAFSLIHSGARPTAGMSLMSFAQATFAGHLGQDGQDAGVVDAGAHVQHRRHADGLADLAQARARHFQGAWGVMIAYLALAMAPQPVSTTSTSFLRNSVTT